MLKTAIFDMDGVIVDSHPVHRQAWREFFLALGRTLSDRELAYVEDGRKRDEILRHFLGEHLSAEELQEYGMQKDRWFTHCAAELQLIAGVRDFISAWESAGVRLAVASSGSRRRVEETLERFGLKHDFAAIVSGNDVANGKPDPAIFQAACQRLGGDPKATLVIEDAVSGVRAARAAGMKCMGVADDRRAHLLYGAGAHFVVPDFVGLETNEISQLFDRAG